MNPAKSMIVIASGLALAACGQGGDGNAAVADNTTTAGAVAATPGGATLWNSGQAKPLDIQVAHPNGVVLQVTSLQSRQTDTAVGIRVINGRDREIDLNRFPNNRNGFLLLESGERLFLSPPASNARLTVPAGQTFEGELVFLGRLPMVRTGVMVLNEQQSGDNQYTTTPGFRIDLPLTEPAQ
ncbi:hypothetical protein [Sphingomonas sp. AX6]|uniref:hypothetical protein n=1 Tax=Sphingomonas sp. AX6 TaxID=2653171 RepID=UPI0012F3E206|nr:hypothetical protein [Sphingomonas sp. AX6]VXC43259.1 conserved exported hypothetical protein [Sphingomonas sp. AX6]